MAEPAISPQPSAAAGLPPASLARRALALVVDSSITISVSVVVFLCGCAWLFGSAVRKFEPELAGLTFALSCCVSLAIPYLFVVFYHTLQTAAAG